MREIEIKVRLQDKEGLLATLAGKGVALGEPVHQRDQVFGLPGEAGGDGNTVPWLRVRTETHGQGENETKRTLFTLKRSVTGQLDSIERETEVGDPDVMIAIVKELGFVPF